MNAERLQKLRERADQAVKLGMRISAIAAIVPSVASTSYREHGRVSQDDWTEIIDAGKREVGLRLERQLESLIAVEPETTEEPKTCN